jgi:arylsulfatase A-like enzyme
MNCPASLPPNILIITADELRGDCTGFAGNRDVRTPHLDQLAASGTVLEKHFVPFPKCVPSRVAMLTGRHPHTDGLRTVKEANHVPAGRPNLVECLRHNGYETAVLGLNHVWTQDAFYGAGAQLNKKGAGVVDYTSFTDGPLQAMATTPRTYQPGTPRQLPDYPVGQNMGEFGLRTGEQSAFSDDNRADQACLYLRQVRDPSKPFYLQLNLSRPHPPYHVHEPFYSMYDPASITPFPHQLPRNAALPLRAQRTWRTGDAVPTAILREVQALYYGMISAMDALVGRVLATLDELGLRDNTLILFCSDHGDYAGQYGLIEKWDGSLQDCLLHVPCVLSGPGIPRGSRVSSLTELIDTPATILDYLGIAVPARWVMHGQSLLPAIHGGPARDAVFASGGHEASMRARFNADPWECHNGTQVKATAGKQLTYAQCPDAMARCKMVRTADWKLIVRETGDNELFHLAEDPHEMVNLYQDFKYSEVVCLLQERLLRWTLSTDTDLPFIADVAG